MIFFPVYIEIEGKGGWIIEGVGGGKRVCWPPLKLLEGPGPLAPPLPTPMKLQQHATEFEI